MIFNDERDSVRYLPGRWETVGVSRRTWYRWMDGKARIPRAVVVLAQILVDGELHAIDPAWRGWRLVRGKLWDPSNTWHTTDTIARWHYTCLELAERRRRGRLGAILQRLNQKIREHRRDDARRDL